MPVSPHDGNRFLRGVMRHAQRLEQIATVRAVALLRGNSREEPDEWLKRAVRGVPAYQESLTNEVKQRLPHAVAELRAAKQRAVEFAEQELSRDGGKPGERDTKKDTETVTAITNAWHRYPGAAADKVRRVAQQVRNHKAATVVEKLAGSEGLLRRELGSGMRVVPVGTRNYGISTFTTMKAMTDLSQAVMDAYTNSPSRFYYVPLVPTECGKCEPWLGEVLAAYPANGLTIVDGSVVNVRYSVGDARRAGLWHPNCRHTAVVFTPGVTRVGVVEAHPPAPLWEVELRREKHEHLARLEHAAAVTKSTADKAASIIKRFVSLRKRKK